MATWRVGVKLGRTLYKDDVCVGMVDTPALAEEICARMNEGRAWSPNTDVDTLPLCDCPEGPTLRWDAGLCSACGNRTSDDGP
jgi:hypothetical protein